MKVRDLISFLSRFPDDADVYSIGPDCGGYDCEFGLITTTKTLQDAVKDYGDFQMERFPGLQHDNAESPCIFHSAQDI